jgi:putative transposase
MDLASQKECTIEESHLMTDHVHILIPIPPKYSVSQVVGFIKGTKCNLDSTKLSGAKEKFYGSEFFGQG